jgi:hypothetical protein
MQTSETQRLRTIHSLLLSSSNPPVTIAMNFFSAIFL